jgi:hypothetical protein
MWTGDPNVARLGNRGTDVGGFEVMVGLIAPRCDAKIADERIDLRHLKTRQLDIELQIATGPVFEKFPKRAVVPVPQLGDALDADAIGLQLVCRKSLYEECRNLRQP